MKITYELVIMETRLITHNDKLLLKQFVDNYNILSNSRKIFLSSLQGRIIRIFQKNNVIVGGYIINDKPKYLYFDYLPQSKIDNFTSQYGTNNIAEITCAWYRRRYFYYLSDFICFYLTMMSDIHYTKKEYFFGGSFIEKVKKVHMNFATNLIHHGIEKNEDINKEYWIYWGERKNIPKNITLFTDYAFKYCHKIKK